MDRSNRNLLALTATALLVASACTGSTGDAADSERVSGGAYDPALVTLPPVSAEQVGAPPTDDPGHTLPAAAVLTDRAATAAVIDSNGQLGIVRDGTVSNEWLKFDAFPSPDRSTAVMTLDSDIAGIGPMRPIMWAGLPDGEALAEQLMRTDSELTATSLDGTFAGFTTPADERIEGAIAGSRGTSDIEIISRDAGSVFRQELEGNFVPEAFGRRLTADGIPALVFLLEYFPADAPRFYRVRVLSTETGEVSLPVNLRNKVEQVDERMAGFSRSQVVAEEHGLLFTLYRGTIDGTPEGEPYAFVHTLDFNDGVWCLDVDPRLELDRLPGSLVAEGDRLYVASANGHVGSFPIPSITDPEASPTMDWVVEAVSASDDAPLMIADDDVVFVADSERSGFVAHVHQTGVSHPAVRMFGGGEPTAFDQGDGEIQAVGDHWATFGHFERPDWFGEIEVLVVD